ncbi:MAG TPA: adenine phosphoribosyltransferase [Cellulomonadaceae bacterium]|nr:adenine phosphoribosyltransferase [Cellulomonadaceae bacterium]
MTAYPDGVQIAERVRALVRDIPDYPEPGVVFKDITPLLADGPAFSAVIDHLAGCAGEIDLVAGIEARGFIFGAPVAHALGVGFLPVRKAGKLPHVTLQTSYDLEYGSASIEIHADSVSPGTRVLVVDDVLATGGTAAATARLLEAAGAVVTRLAFLLEIPALGGRALLAGRELDVILSA